MPLSPSSSVIALLHAAVVMNAGSKNHTFGSSLRHSVASTPPSTMGTSIDSPVRLSVIVMESGIDCEVTAVASRRGPALLPAMVRNRAVDGVDDLGERFLGVLRFVEAHADDRAIGEL